VASDTAPARVDEERLLSLLAEAHAASPGELPVLVDRCAADLGLGRAAVYLVDLQQRRLQAMDGSDDLDIDGTLAGWSYRTLTVRVADAGELLTAWFPLVDGGERLGVVGIRTGTMDAVRMRRGRMLAAILAMLITSKRSHSDILSRIARTRPMELPAEMLRAFLPPRTIGNAEATSTAVLEPAYELGGDAFDHTLTSTRLDATIFDAMGHSLASGLATSVAMAGGRNARRNEADLQTIVETIDDALARWLPEQFCTAVFAQLDLHTGTLRWCNCGHPPPLLIRDHRVVPRALECPPQLPLGMPGQLGAGARQVHETRLLPGDRILLYTDGVTEARMNDGTLFGMERFTEAIIRATAAGELPSEVLRRLIHQILDRGDSRLRDDATILLLEWRPR
jgi:serine phosphatase RsbU (regulator of sigma subunit)